MLGEKTTFAAKSITISILKIPSFNKEENPSYVYRAGNSLDNVEAECSSILSFNALVLSSALT